VVLKITGTNNGARIRLVQLNRIASFRRVSIKSSEQPRDALMEEAEADIRRRHRTGLLGKSYRALLLAYESISRTGVTMLCRAGLL